MIKNKGGISVGDQTAVNTWTSKCSIYSGTGDIGTSGLISAGGNISSGGNITTSTGTITGKSGSFQNLTVTGGTVKPATPSAAGVYIGLDSGNEAGDMEICVPSLPYIDFTVPSIASKGRILYDHSTNDFKIFVARGLVNATLNTTRLNVVGTVTTTSDKRFKLNEKPLVNALDIINKLEPVEYDQTYDLVDAYTPETPQSHQCGFIAQSVQQIDELKHAVVGGDIGEDGKESVRALNYNAVFTYAVKAIQELHEIVKQQQIQIDAHKQNIDKLINIILTS